MADLFTVTAPLTIRAPDKRMSIMAAHFSHPKGLLYFDLYWDLVAENQGLDHAAHIISGTLKGEGPWKIGDHIINVLGCHGSDPQLAHTFSQWQLHFQQRGYQLNSRDMLKQKALELGALVRED